MEVFAGFTLLSIFLIAGTILRARVKLLQKIFLPASVIGGLLGLILGPVILGRYAVLPIPQSWLDIYAVLPGILIVPVVAAVPLGTKFKSWKRKGTQKPAAGNKSGSSVTRNAAITAGILFIIAQGQNLLGIAMHGLFNRFNFVADTYPTFGTEVGGGFTGGHGTAGVIGSLLESMNQPYWFTAQGITVTTATFGLIGGILTGIFIINMGARRGHTAFLDKPGDFPEDMMVGYQKDSAKQASFGRETTLSSSIDTLAFHFAFILGGSGLAYGLLQILKYFSIPVLQDIPIWAYAILLMYLVWWALCGLELDWIVDSAISSKISGAFTDFAVVAAVASMPIQAVLSYFTPVLIMTIVIGLFTALTAYFLSKKYFKEFWIEKSVAILGTSFGVFITGLLLLKMADPEFKSPSLNEFSIGYSVNSVAVFVAYPILFSALINSGLLAGSMVSAVIILAGIGLIAFGARKS